MTNQWTSTDYKYSAPLWDYPSYSNYINSTTDPTWSNDQAPYQAIQYPYSEFGVPPPPFIEHSLQIAIPPPEFTEHPVEFRPTVLPPDLPKPCNNNNNIIVISPEIQTSVKKKDSYSYFGFTSDSTPTLDKPKSIAEKNGPFTVRSTTNEEKKRSQHNRKKVYMSREKALECLWATHLQECAKYKENPELHPDYKTEKSIRNKFLISKGLDVHSKTLDDDWDTFWQRNLEEILQKEWEKKKYHCLAEFQEKEDRGSPVSSTSSSSSCKKRTSSASSRSSCEKKRSKSKMYDQLSFSAKYEPSKSKRYRHSSSENETVIRDLKEHSYRSFSKDNNCKTTLLNSSKKHDEHHISRERDSVGIKNYKYDDNNLINDINNESYYQEYGDKLLKQSVSESDIKSSKTDQQITTKEDSLEISDLNFKNVYGSYDDFDGNIQCGDFKPMQRKNIKLILKGDKHSKSFHKHSNVQDDFHGNKISAGNTEFSNIKTDTNQNLENTSFSKNDMRNLYGAEISKNAIKEKSNSVFRTIPLNLPHSTNVVEDSVIHADSLDSDSHVNIFAKPTGDQPANATIADEAIELLGLFHSLSSNFGVLSVPITLLHEKFIDCKQKGSSLMGCFDDDAVALLEMISSKLSNFLKASDISLVQSTVYKLASRRLAALITAVDKAKIDESKKSNSFLYGLDLLKMATACAGKDCSETVKFIKISLLYQNLPMLSSDQIMEIYIAVKTVQASFLSKSKFSEIFVPKSVGNELGYGSPHSCLETNSRLSLSEMPFKKIITVETSYDAVSNKLCLSPHHSSDKFTKSVVSDKTNISSSSNKNQNSSYVSSCDKDKSSKTKQHDCAKSYLSDLKKSERLSPPARKILRKKHTESTRSRSPNQKVSQKKIYSKSNKSCSKSPSDQKNPLRSKDSNSSKPSLPKQKSLDGIHQNTIPKPFIDNECMAPSKSELHNSSLTSHNQTKSSTRKKHSSPNGKNKSSPTKQQISSLSLDNIQGKYLNGKNHNFPQSLPPSQNKPLNVKNRISSRSSSSQKKYLKIKHNSSSHSSSLSKTKQNLKTNHLTVSPDLKTSRAPKSSSVADPNMTSSYNKRNHYCSPDLPSSEGQKLSSQSAKKKISSCKVSSSCNNKNKDRYKNSYGSSRQNHSRPVSLSLTSIKPTTLPKFNIFGNFDDDNYDCNADNDNLKKKSRKADYVFPKREPVESFLKNCKSSAEATFIRKLYQQIHNMDVVEKIKYYIDFNSHSENVKKLLAVHADEIALVDPNLAQSMKWRIENLSRQNGPRSERSRR